MSRMPLQIALLIVASAALTGVRVLVQPSAREVFKPIPLAPGEVSFESAINWRPPPIWIDARSRQAFEREHIKDANLLTLDVSENFEELLFAIDKTGILDGSRPVVVYCDSQQCKASKDVAARLRERYSHLQIYTLHNGWQKR